METEVGGTPVGRRLNTWKEIATFFGRDERTVKRWEVSRKLPVHRIPNRARSIVFAYESELADWLRSGGTIDADMPDADPVAAEAETVPLIPRRNWTTPAITATMGVLCAVVLTASAFLIGSSRSDERNGQSAPMPYARNAQAESFYKAGLYEWQTRTPAGLTHAVDDFTQATVHDPNFAPAYVGLADCFDVLREYTTMPAGVAYPRAIAAAKRAIALDPSLGSAHAALAFAEFYWLRDKPAGFREFRRAIALSPRDAMAHHWYANALAQTGAYADAIAQIEQAEALDSESSAIRADKAFDLVLAGRSGEAFALLQRLEQSEPSFYSAHIYLAYMDLQRGDDAGYLNELTISAKLRRDDGNAAVAAAGAAGLAKGGHMGMLNSILDEQKSLYAQGKSTAYAIAASYAALNDADDTVAWLRRSFERHEADNVGFAADPAFAQLRARFGDLLPQAAPQPPA
jgi:tetratricopeptide (TPR) repeat protein